jgi:hypothetical protein
LKGRQPNGPGRLVEQLVPRQVEVPSGNEQNGVERVGAEPEVGAAIGEHRTLPGGVDQGDDHTGALPSANLEVHLGPGGSKRPCRGAAELVVADGGYQVDLRAGSGERHGLVGS